MEYYISVENTDHHCSQIQINFACMHVVGIHIIFGQTLKHTHQWRASSHILNLHSISMFRTCLFSMCFIGRVVDAGFYIICTQNYTYFNQRENSRHLSTLTRKISEQKKRIAVCATMGKKGRLI